MRFMCECLVPHNTELVKQGSEHYYRSDTLPMSGWNNGFFPNGFPFFYDGNKGKSLYSFVYS